jgi:alpha-2-macroglobulin
LRTAAEAALRSRIVYEGRRLDLVDAKAAPWWMMVNKDGMAIHALMAVIGRRGWDQDAPRMMIGVALRQARGHWDTTTANAWGTLAVRRFASVFPSPTGGVTRATFGGFHFEHPWGDTAPIRFPLPAAQTMLQLSHSTQPPPWATILVRAAVPLKAPLFSGYRLSRQVSFVERHNPGQLSRGDVLKVRITVDAPVDRTWVVIEDPIPAGSSVISGGGNQSTILADKAGGHDEGAWPSYIERGFDSWRAYFEWMPQGRTTIEYVVRINSVGRFQLSPTRVEAMYSPEIHGALPNQPVVVAP